jgi:secreted trypsin-like serine protease
MRTSLLAFALASFALGCSSGRDGKEGAAIESTQQAIQGGTSTGASYPFTVGISLNGGQELCSGSLIAPNLVLTARHCVAETAPGNVDCTTAVVGATFATRSFGVTTNPNMFASNAKYYSVAEVIQPADTTFCGNDIALLRLTANVPASEATPAAPVVQHKSFNTSRYDTKVTAVGYGATSAANTGAGTRRIKRAINILCMDGSRTYCTSAQTADFVKPTEMITDPGTCSGDSGSGAYDDAAFTGGTYWIHGVLSRGGSTGNNCAEAVYTRTDAFADLIQATGIAAATAGGYPAPAWTQTEPQEAGDTPFTGGPGTIGVDGGKKDAGGGGTADAGPGKTAGLGESCEGTTSCASDAGECLDFGAGFVCATSCTENASCGAGFQCKGNYCQAGDPEPETTTTTTTGCSTTAPTNASDATPMVLVLGVALAGIVSRKRR